MASVAADDLAPLATCHAGLVRRELVCPALPMSGLTPFARNLPLLSRVHRRKPTVAFVTLGAVLKGHVMISSVLSVGG
jgi:hypothetical protein